MDSLYHGIFEREESGFLAEEKLARIKKETGELKGIFITIVRNVKEKSKHPKS